MVNYGNQEVYVIQHELGPVKIGIAKNPEQRLSNLQVSCPYQLHIKKTKSTPQAEEVEKYLHSHFRKYHMSGEWFDIPHPDRDFEIPQRITLSGKPNIDVGLTEGREMDYEWAYILERLYHAMKVTKYAPPEIREIRSEWKEIKDAHEDKEEDEDDQSAGGLEDVRDDIPKGMIRCSGCGFMFEKGSDGCPTCGSGSFTHRRQ